MESLFDEIESLEAILMEDVIIHKNAETNIPEMIETTVFPVVGIDTDRQYICVTLQVVPTTGYPDVSPEFRLIKPRGLDDKRINEITAACIEKINESQGFPVVFDLIEVIREHLTDSNLPSGQCVVCLYGFQDGDEFTKTECYHYLHSFCLSRHLIASKNNWQEEQEKLPAWLKKTAEPFQPVCPVCREKINDDVDNLKQAPPPTELENAPDFQLTDDLKQMQMKMSNLFLLQKSRGAIIEVGENDGNVISIEPEYERLENQRKHNGEANESKENGESANKIVPNSLSTSNNRQNHNRSIQNNRGQSNACSSASATGSNAAIASPTASNNSRIIVNQTNFTPIVNSCPRYTTEPSNNNYNHQQHYNRRHYRGNNRRHHHRDHRDHRGGGGEQSSQQQQDNAQQQSHVESATKTTSGNNTNSGGGGSSAGGSSSGKHQKSGNNHHHGSSNYHKR